MPEVIDAWYDSGSMPFAQLGAPWRNQDAVRARPTRPSSSAEAIDQTRGWFYSLMAVGTLVFGRSSYENVVCLGLVVDERGRKMSKHLGNVLEPIPLMETHGADAVRWFFAASGSPWATRRIGARHAGGDRPQGPAHLLEHRVLPGPVRERRGRAGAGLGPGPGGQRAAARGPAAARPVAAQRAARDGRARSPTALEGFDTAAAGRRLAAFIDDMSNWYVRRSRRRFWDGPGSPDGAAAFATLYECLDTLTRLMAPITPFLTDYVWGGAARRRMTRTRCTWPSWPTADPALIDDRLSGQMALTRRLVELGRSARAAAVGAGPPAAGPRRWSARPGSPTWHPSCAPRWPASSTCARCSRWRRSATTWSTTW